MWTRPEIDYIWLKIKNLKKLFTERSINTWNSLPNTVAQAYYSGLTGNILIGEWQIALLVHFRRVMECSCKSTLKICRLEFYLTSFTNSKLFLPSTVERKVFDC